MSQISRKNSFGKVVSNFWSEILCRHFVIVYLIFDFFFFFLLYFVSFGLFYQWPAFHRQIHSGKYFSELGSIGTNGSAEGLDHLSVKLYRNRTGDSKDHLAFLNSIPPTL